MTAAAIAAHNLAIVLVQPEHAGNIGAAARALGNLGLADLRLVQGAEPDAAARAFACTFQGLLESAARAATLSAALADCVFAVALVSPMRGRDSEPCPLRALQPRIAELTARGKVALVFGSEQSGLSHHDVARCNVAATLPLPSPWPTLNLAQAVLLAGYELLCVPGEATAMTAAAGGGDDPVTQAELDAALHGVSAALTRLGYGGDAAPLQRRILDRCRAIAGRAVLTRADVSMLLGVLTRLGRGGT